MNTCTGERWVPHLVFGMLVPQKGNPVGLEAPFVVAVFLKLGRLTSERT